MAQTSSYATDYMSSGERLGKHLLKQKFEGQLYWSPILPQHHSALDSNIDLHYDVKTDLGLICKHYTQLRNNSKQ